MSVIFKRINSIHYEAEHTFAMSDELYELLIGDENMPMSSNDTMPVAVGVPLARIAVVLQSVGFLSPADIRHWGDNFVKAVRDEKSRFNKNGEKDDLLQALYIDKELCAALKKDFGYANRRDWPQIDYLIS